jgi:3-hydroxyacyl-CoA dehydrogenase/enoyl-CoA hydratase/3-hydroxybutyryl-CoA epimerase
VAADDSATRIGLPETQLGLLPAWGGSTRLPALVGLPAALAVILGGKLHSARAAWKKGLVDAVVSPEHLEAAARGQLVRGKCRRQPRRLLHSGPAVAFIRRKATRDVLARTRGNYPALPKAIEVVCGSVRAGHTASLAAEREAFLGLVGGDVASNLVQLFFQTEKARRRAAGGVPSSAVSRVAVIGAGVMGSGIAQWLAARGCRVLMKDISPAALAAGMARVDRLLEEAVARHLMSGVEARAVRDRIWPVCGEASLAACDLVIEAATEDLELKRRIFADLVAATTERTVLATNTSALPIRELIGDLPGGEQAAGRVVGLHFFNPVHRMKLVEVVRSAVARPEVVDYAVDFVRRIGKLPVVVADEPGFLVNRILLPYLLDAARLFGEGVSAAEIDAAMLDFGMPMGPLRLLDEVGLDVGLHVAGTLVAAHPDRLAIPVYLNDLVEQGALGRKAGRGFYLYGAAGGGRRQQVNPRAEQLRSVPAAGGPGREAIRNRLSGHLSHEARLCLEEGIAETAGEIDFAMVMGTGYAPFRGGPLHDAGKRGAATAVQHDEKGTRI